MKPVITEPSCESDARAIDSPYRLGGAVVGTLADFASDGEPRVMFAGGSPVEARSCVRVERADAGRGVVLLFEDNRVNKPIIVGLLDDRRAERQRLPSTAPVVPGGQITIDLDGRRMVLSAKQEIVLTCGDASITLTRAGKIIMRGAYVSSHASGVNRIKGATVEIN
jgi:Domain of unknown function (DUF6484)